MKIYIENNQAIPAVQVQPDGDSAPIGYTEVTDIVSVEKYGMKEIDNNIPGWRDKKSVRDKLKTMIYTKMQVQTAADTEDDNKYNLLNSQEQEIALNWFIVGKESWQLALKNDDKYWTVKAAEYRAWSTIGKIPDGVKQKRLFLMEALVFRRILNVAKAKDILQTINQVTKDTNINIANNILTDKLLVKSLSKQYVEGIDGSVEDNDSVAGITFIGLTDFIDSRTNTPFSSNGFRNYPDNIFRAGHAANSVSDELLSIINGTW